MTVTQTSSITTVGPDGGLNFYSLNNFAAAAAAGFDTTAIPMGPYNTNIQWVPDTPNQPDGSIALYLALGWNCFFSSDNNPSLYSTMLGNGIYSWGGALGNPAQVGIYNQDEPNTWNINNPSSDEFPGWYYQGQVADASQSGMPWLTNFTTNILTVGEITPNTGQPAARTDTGCSTTINSPVVNNPNAQGKADVGKVITGPNIPPNAFVLASTAGVSQTIGTQGLYMMGPSPVLTTVPATASGSGLTMTVGGIDPSVAGTAKQGPPYPIATPSGGSYRHMDAIALDGYWMSAPGWTFAQALAEFLGFTPSGADQWQRGSHYGLQVDAVRAYMTPVFPGPIMGYVETGNAFGDGSGDTTMTTNITPEQINWAIWSILIHGGRGIAFLDHWGCSTTGELPYLANMNYTVPYRTIQPGESVSVYTQLATTDKLVQALAPALNDNTALGACTVTGAVGTPNGPGAAFPACYGSGPQILNGIDVLVKQYGSDYYIFAGTRNSQTWSGSVTFQLDPSITVSSLTLVQENRTVPIAGGQFTDTFASGSTVHIYSTNPDPLGGTGSGGGPPTPPPTQSQFPTAFDSINPNADRLHPSLASVLNSLQQTIGITSAPKLAPTTNPVFFGTLGFAGHAPQPQGVTVSGSKGGNDALASLITALANYGLIVDETT